MDWIPWSIRAILISVGIILAIIILKGKKEGRYQEYYIRFFIIGITTFVLGVILLVLSFITDQFWDYGLFLTAAGIILFGTGTVIRKTWEKNR